MSSNVKAVVGEAFASSNKVNDHCRLVLVSVPEYLVDQAFTSHLITLLVSLLVSLLKRRQLRPNVLRCC